MTTALDKIVAIARRIADQRESYCSLSGEHRTNPCRCGWPNEDDRELIEALRHLDEGKRVRSNPREKKS